MTEREEDAENTSNAQSQPPNADYYFHLQRISKPEPQETTEKDEETPSATEDLQTGVPAPRNNGEDVKKSNPQGANDEAKSSNKPNISKTKFHSDDPIHWYGILVPASLRNAQRSFTEAVQSEVPELAGVVVEMRALEQRITKLRTEIGTEPMEEANSS